MRTLVDIDESQVRQLDALARIKNQSRAALLRQAVADYLDNKALRTAADAYGLWSGKKIDGLEYQEKVRREW